MTYRDLRRLQRDWEDLGATDPLWAILSHPARRHGRWDLAEFLETGEREIAALMQRSEVLGRPATRDRALDFGCGVGRLTRALALRFNQAVGVDISTTMIGQARRLNADRPNCTFLHNVRSDLSLFTDGSFDLAYTTRVLQHLPDRSTAEGYIAELVRVLRPGGLLVFQVPGSLPRRHRIQPRRRLHLALQSLGITSTPVHRRLGLHPIRMMGLPEARAVEIVAASGGSVLATDVRRLGATSIEDRTFFVTR
jgi:SAM-dependent methyltransferase